MLSHEIGPVVSKILNFINATHLGYLNEYFRPWKLVTLILGATLLILGSFYYTAPDWDIPISIIMAIFTYIFAPWSMRVLLERRWRLWPLVFFFTWFSVDGCYAIYWHFKNPVALGQMREANFPASLTLFLICGFIWLYRGSLKQFFIEIQDLFHLTRTKHKCNRQI
jgi:hypothetical protein